ncbi:hypothetical protein MNBD_GAMMA14-1844 [hydrothermal vent metagenome]|uniref:Uncharacterized protein n=1 Tax=hydrothermal vent metagenome TaxID=652676 RepID=A0A3B0ZDB1_9ZZZZ
MENRKPLYIGLIVTSLVLALVYFTTVNKNTTSQSGQQSNKLPTPVITLQKKTPQSAVTTKPAPEQQDLLAEAVDEQFADKPDIQKAWVRRGQTIVLKNHPMADSANFRGSFFHRGFKDLAVTCGEVQFRANGKIIGNYQRFIYSGGQLSYLETDVQNFYLLWDKLCVQIHNK